MSLETRIRPETAADIDAIRNATDLAFRDMPYASGTEADIVNRLRDQGALSLSLVATIDDEVVGHVAFSPAKAADASQPWFTLGPVSVVPERQRQGIGSALMKRGLEILRKQQALGCILTGNPDYYRRFGFEVSPENSVAEEYAEFFMVKRLANINPTGAIAFHAAFGEDG